MLGDPAVANLPPGVADTIGGGLTLELEVAGTPVPLLALSPDQIAQHLDPGLDGVAMRRGTSWAMLFPAQMLATNTAGRVERMLPALGGDLGLSPMPLRRLAELHGVSVYRFRTTHLAQAGPMRPPFETFRGDTIVAESAVTKAAIVALADDLARYLMAMKSPLRDPVGIMGTYRPAADRYDPLIAPPLEQAMVALALARYSKAPGVAEEEAAARAGHAIMRELQLVAPAEEDPLASAVACAAIVHAGLEPSNPDPAYRRLVNEASQRVLSAYRIQEGFMEIDEETDEQRGIPAHGRAMVAAALSRLLLAGTAGVEPQLVRSALDAAWASVPLHQQVALLPWLGWAEADFATATGRPLAQRDALLGLRDVLEASRFGSPARSGGPPDLAGGFALGSGDRLIATAQTLRPAAYLAAMMRDPRLTPPEEGGLALGRHLKTMRFMMQLSVRESATWAFRNPARARGGIRGATWDSDQPVAAQALGLITAAETLISLEALALGSHGNRPRQESE